VSYDSTGLTVNSKESKLSDGPSVHCMVQNVESQTKWPLLCNAVWSVARGNGLYTVLQKGGTQHEL